MRTAPNNDMYNLWVAGGPFIGDAGAPHGRITIQPAWELRASTATTFDITIDGVFHANGYDRGPIRYFQNSDNAQTEYELPNVQVIDIDRSVDTDAATLKFVMVNQKMLPNGQILTGTAGESVGQPGFYWPGYGDSATSLTRWGHTTNIFNNLIQPNALVRVYQGYGGRDKDINQALTDGNIILTGIFLVDEISQDAGSGSFSISCRDMAKLLIEQTLYPPLVPVGKDQSAHYPLTYNRWKYINHPVIPYGATVYRTGFQALIQSTMTNAFASSHYDDGTTVHIGADAADGQDPSTYWLSSGRITGDTSADFEFLQFDLNGSPLIGGLNLQPFAGNYVMYVSVMESGSWVDPFSQSIPYTGTRSGVAIPYVIKLGVGWEKAGTIDFGADYNADKVRVTFGHLAKVAPGPLYYAAGVRDMEVGAFTSTVSGAGRNIVGMARGSNTVDNGYWLAGSDGGVFSFGDLKFFGSEGSAILNGNIVGIASDPATGGGYRLGATDGGVFDFGDLYYKGSLPGDGVSASNVVGIENGDQGHSGYYLVQDDGTITAYGTALTHAHSGGTVLSTGVSSMAVKANGYWLVDLAGTVESFGTATHYGDWSGTPDGFITAIESTSTGNGYWLVTALGSIQAFGDAVNFGDLPGDGIVLGVGQGIVDIARTFDDHGYWLVGQDGGVFVPGAGTGSGNNHAKFSGSLPEQYSAVGDGNYKDYLDIVKDLLLWSGWWFHDPALGDATPAVVFGTLESTGIFAPDMLTEDFFDKKPVIDVINTIKEIVGYISYADEIGAWQFKSPNVWSIGNFLDTGQQADLVPGTPLQPYTGGVPTTRMPVIDEQQQIIQYQVTMNDTDARSQIIIATEDPALGISDTKSVSLTSQWGPEVLRGLIRPALWVNGKFITTEVQRTMAELIDLHLFMQQRQGSLTMPANPIIQIDDQVRVYERTTSEVYVHYVRGYSTHMDLESGEFTQTLQLHWMGDGNAFFLQYTT